MEKQKDSRQRLVIEENLQYKAIFAASQLELTPHPCGGYLCNLYGEFYKVQLPVENEEEKEIPFDPPFTYSLSNVQVATSDAQSILRDIYHYLLEENNWEEELKKIGFV